MLIVLLSWTFLLLVQAECPPLASQLAGEHLRIDDRLLRQAAVGLEGGKLVIKPKRRKRMAAEPPFLGSASTKLSQRNSWAAIRAKTKSWWRPLPGTDRQESVNGAQRHCTPAVLGPSRETGRARLSKRGRKSYFERRRIVCSASKSRPVAFLSLPAIPRFGARGVTSSGRYSFRSFRYRSLATSHEGTKNVR